MNPGLTLLGATLTADGVQTFVERVVRNAIDDGADRTPICIWGVHGIGKTALVEDGIPFTSFAVENVAEEHKRLEALGVTFTQPPTDYGSVIAAVFDDTCGNLIQIAQKTGDGPG